MNKNRKFIIYGALAFYIQIFSTPSCLSRLVENEQLQCGYDFSLQEIPLEGPGKRIIWVPFQSPFSLDKETPQVLISFTELHFSLKPKNHFTTSVANITHEGFTIIYEVQTSDYVMSGKLSWMAFNQQKFGEVAYFQTHNTRELNTFHQTGDEHRSIRETIKFTHNFTWIPYVAVYLIGAQNKGREWIVAAHPQKINKHNFTLALTAWHHTDVEYLKVAILAFEKNQCYIHDAQQYQWDERHHQWPDFIWNRLERADPQGFRLQNFNYQVKYTNFTQFPFFSFQGIAGYDVQDGNFTLALKNSYINVTNFTYSIDVGPWQDTQLAGAYWNFFICNTERENIKHVLPFLIFGSTFSIVLVALVLICINQASSNNNTNPSGQEQGRDDKDNNDGVDDNKIQNY